MRCVLRSNGRFVLCTPHAGLFAWLDANNFRFRLPTLYRRIVGQGRRDAGYANGSDGVVWHEHFSANQLLRLLGEGWELETCRTGGLVMFPLLDIASWPFYRTRRTDLAAYRVIQKWMNADIGRDYCRASYDILLVLR